MSTPKRQELLERFFQEISRNSTWTVIYHQALAAKLGLNPTDLKCAALLRETGPVTAGELAGLMALTTGAVTGVIDRLEKIDLVQRQKDPADRRRVVVKLTSDPARLSEVEAMYRSLGEAAARELTPRYSDEELEVILDFLATGTRILQQETAKLGAKALRSAALAKPNPSP